MKIMDIKWYVAGKVVNLWPFLALGLFILVLLIFG